MGKLRPSFKKQITSITKPSWSYTNSPYEVRSYKILGEIVWDNLEMRRNRQESIFMYNIVKGDAPTLLKNL